MATLKALVVDDAAFVRDLVKRTLRSQFPFMDVQEAADGRKAQALLTRSYFDLILCDWEMPQMSGLELLRWARQHEAYQKTPFVMVTSRGDREHVVEAIQGGVSDYLGKPFSPEALGRKVIKVMGTKLQQAAGAGAAPGAESTLRASAELLTAATPQPPGQPAGAGAARPRTRPPQPAEGHPRHNLASLRFADHRLQSVLKAVTLTEARLLVRRQDPMPAILESAVLDIQVSGDQVARLNGYVHQLQAVDQSRDTDFVAVTIRFVDEDPQKMEDLTHFIARFQRS